LLDWAIWDAMFKAQNAFEGVMSNYPNRAAARILRWFVFPLGRPYVVPSDKLGHEVAKLLIEPSPTRDRLTADMYIPREEDIISTLERALHAVIAAEPIEAKIRAAVKAGRIRSFTQAETLQAALQAGIISAEELAQLEQAIVLRNEVIRVDDFPPDLSLGESTRPKTARAVA
ncbi:MAG: DUF1974 domain-containing protein, partial [Burkholderiales bacterium]|nr:DUF1974 domain-containing protein [Burkholderiales bacterium]